MKSMRIKLISFLLVIVLAAFMLTGCSSLDLIIDYLFSTPSQAPEEPEVDEFSLEDAINEITTSKMCAEVTISIEYRSILSTSLGTVQGSGTVIMRTESTLLYVLTNAHCVTTPDNITAQKYNKSIYMTDYRGNVYSGGKVYAESVDEERDLALITFACDNWDVQPLTLAKSNPSIGDTVIALGSPHAQMNSITVGKAVGYYDSDIIECEALYHSAPVGSGGSGGALLNTDLELCGVNFAADISEGDFGNGSSIPIESVREYLADFSIFKLIL